MRYRSLRLVPDRGGNHVHTCAFASKVPVSRTLVAGTHGDGRAFAKRTFPLALGYVMTAHRYQGATLAGRVILDVRSARRLRLCRHVRPRLAPRTPLLDFTPVATAGFFGEDDAAKDAARSEGAGDADSGNDAGGSVQRRRPML